MTSAGVLFQVMERTLHEEVGRLLPHVTGLAVLTGSLRVVSIADSTALPETVVEAARGYIRSRLTLSEQDRQSRKRDIALCDLLSNAVKASQFLFSSSDVDLLILTDGVLDHVATGHADSVLTDIWPTRVRFRLVAADQGLGMVADEEHLRLLERRSQRTEPSMGTAGMHELCVRRYDLDLPLDQVMWMRLSRGFQQCKRRRVVELRLEWKEQVHIVYRIIQRQTLAVEISVLGSRMLLHRLQNHRSAKSKQTLSRIIAGTAHVETSSTAAQLSHALHFIVHADNLAADLYADYETALPTLERLPFRFWSLWARCSSIEVVGAAVSMEALVEELGFVWHGSMAVQGSVPLVLVQRQGTDTVCSIQIASLWATEEEDSLVVAEWMEATKNNCSGYVTRRPIPSFLMDLHSNTHESTPPTDPVAVQLQVPAPGPWAQLPLDPRLIHYGLGFHAKVFPFDLLSKYMISFCYRWAVPSNEEAMQLVQTLKETRTDTGFVSLVEEENACSMCAWAPYEGSFVQYGVFCHGSNVAVNVWFEPGYEKGKALQETEMLFDTDRRIVETHMIQRHFPDLPLQLYTCSFDPAPLSIAKALERVLDSTASTVQTLDAVFGNDADTRALVFEMMQSMDMLPCPDSSWLYLKTALSLVFVRVEVNDGAVLYWHTVLRTRESEDAVSPLTARVAMLFHRNVIPLLCYRAVRSGADLNMKDVQSTIASLYQCSARVPLLCSRSGPIHRCLERTQAYIDQTFVPLIGSFSVYGGSSESIGGFQGALFLEASVAADAGDLDLKTALQQQTTSLSVTLTLAYSHATETPPALHTKLDRMREATSRIMKEEYLMECLHDASTSCDWEPVTALMKVLESSHMSTASRALVFEYPEAYSSVLESIQTLGDFTFELIELAEESTFLLSTFSEAAYPFWMILIVSPTLMHARLFSDSCSVDERESILDLLDAAMRIRCHGANQQCLLRRMADTLEADDRILGLNAPYACPRVYDARFPLHPRLAEERARAAVAMDTFRVFAMSGSDSFVVSFSSEELYIMTLDVEPQTLVWSVFGLRDLEPGRRTELIERIQARIDALILSAYTHILAKNAKLRLNKTDLDFLRPIFSDPDIDVSVALPLDKDQMRVIIVLYQCLRDLYLGAAFADSLGYPATGMEASGTVSSWSWLTMLYLFDPHQTACASIGRGVAFIEGVVVNEEGNPVQQVREGRSLCIRAWVHGDVDAAALQEDILHRFHQCLFDLDVESCLSRRDARAMLELCHQGTQQKMRSVQTLWFGTSFGRWGVEAVTHRTQELLQSCVPFLEMSGSPTLFGVVLVGKTVAAQALYAKENMILSGIVDRHCAVGVHAQEHGLGVCMYNLTPKRGTAIRQSIEPLMNKLHLQLEQASRIAMVYLGSALDSLPDLEVEHKAVLDYTMRKDPRTMRRGRVSSNDSVPSTRITEDPISFPEFDDGIRQEMLEYPLAPLPGGERIERICASVSQLHRHRLLAIEPDVDGRPGELIYASRSPLLFNSCADLACSHTDKSCRHGGSMQLYLGLIELLLQAVVDRIQASTTVAVSVVRSNVLQGDESDSSVVPSESSSKETLKDATFMQNGTVKRLDPMHVSLETSDGTLCILLYFQASFICCDVYLLTEAALSSIAPFLQSVHLDSAVAAFHLHLLHQMAAGTLHEHAIAAPVFCFMHGVYTTFSTLEATESHRLHTSTLCVTLPPCCAPLEASRDTIIGDLFTCLDSQGWSRCTPHVRLWTLGSEEATLFMCHDGIVLEQTESGTDAVLRLFSLQAQNTDPGAVATVVEPKIRDSITSALHEYERRYVWNTVQESCFGPLNTVPRSLTLDYLKKQWSVVTIEDPWIHQTMLLLSRHISLAASLHAIMPTSSTLVQSSDSWMLLLASASSPGLLVLDDHLVLLAVRHPVQDTLLRPVADALIYLAWKRLVAPPCSDGSPAAPPLVHPYS